MSEQQKENEKLNRFEQELSSLCLFLYPEQWKSFIQKFEGNLAKSPNEETSKCIKNIITSLIVIGKKSYSTEWDKQSYPVRQKGVSEGGK